MIEELRMDIQGYKAKIKEIEEVKNKIKEELLPSVEECMNSVTEFASYASEVIINNQPLDQNKMENVTTELSTITENLNSIITECETKIKEYEAKISACESQISSIVAQQSATDATSSSGIDIDSANSPTQAYLKD